MGVRHMCVLDFSTNHTSPLGKGRCFTIVILNNCETTLTLQVIKIIKNRKTSLYLT
ncbi:hypothetical protein HanRHA438_Chr17g0841011 [Helianthus annuus]|nr:hypothetical protein HanRHA438_Chr17g0841011 [Helianthus annuus]